MEIIVVKTIQHGFYTGIESEEKVAVKPNIIEDYLKKAILKEHSLFRDSLDMKKVDRFIKDAIKYGEARIKFDVGCGDFEVAIRSSNFQFKTNDDTRN